MKIVHSADIHLDYKNKQIQKLDASGRNIRELDFFNVFKELIDKVIDIKPDAFIIAGDLFDTPRPSNAVIKSVINQFNRLENSKIRTIVQAGNHDTPQLRTTTSAFESLMEIDYQYIHFVYHSIEKLSFDGVEYIVVPHLSIADGFDPRDLEPNLENNLYSVLILHGVADGSDIFKQVDENREMPLGSHILNMGHTYIALGHYHKRSSVRKNAFYSGSLENGSFGPDAQEKKGALLVDLEKAKNNKNYSPDLIEVSNRKMIDFGTYDALGKTSQEIENELTEIVQKETITDSLCRIKVINITKSLYSNIDKKMIKQLGSSALYFGVTWAINQMESSFSKEAGIANEKIKDIESEWKKEVEHYYKINSDNSLPNKTIVENKGITYIKTFEEETVASEN